MSVYVDPLFDGRAFPADAATRRVGARNGHRWCHMAADTLAELHAMAARIGMRRDWFQGDHYDLTPSRRAKAVAAGALEVSAKELVRAVRRSRLAEHQVPTSQSTELPR